MIMYYNVKRWMSLFKVPMNKKTGLISKERYNLRFNLMKEENEEYLEACKNDDLVEVYDAVIDQMFVLYGTALEHGFTKEQIDLGFKEVSNSNFSKAENGKPIFRSDGKILKGKNFFPPNLKKYL